MNYKLFLLFLLSACNLCYGQQVGGVVKDDDTAVKVWIVDDELQEEGIASLLVQVAEKYKQGGVHRLEGIRKKGPERDYITITITRSTTPSPQPTPQPQPQPTPVDPVPIVNPIRVPGFRVLVVEESAERGKLPRGQLEAITSTKVREYLNQKCAIGSDGKTPEYRFFDDDADTSLMPKVWQDAAKLPRTSLPWVIISNGKEGTSEPLPNSEDEFLTLLKKYGG